MKALSSLAGHDIIFHSARKMMTGSTPHWINAFIKPPLFPWPHIIPGLQSPQRHDGPQHIPPAIRSKSTYRWNSVYTILGGEFITKATQYDMAFLWLLFLCCCSLKAHRKAQCTELKSQRFSVVGIVSSEQSNQSALLAKKMFWATIWKEIWLTLPGIY